MSRDPPLVDFESGGKLDGAETFEESDVALTHTDTHVPDGGGEIQLPPPVDDSVPTGNNGGTFGTSNAYGQKFSALNEIGITQIDVTVGAGGDNITEVWVRDNSGSVIHSETIAAAAGGEVISLTLAEPLVLAPGETFSVEADNGGASYTSPNDQNSDDSSGAWAGTDIQFETSTSGDGSSIAGVRMWDEVRAYSAITSGTAFVEWPDPPDVYRWDATLFQRTTDGESVDVYVEEDDGTGFETIAGPVTRGDDITADPASSVRFRIELSRQNTANTPALDSIHRRYII